MLITPPYLHPQSPFSMRESAFSFNYGFKIYEAAINDLIEILEFNDLRAIVFQMKYHEVYCL